MSDLSEIVIIPILGAFRHYFEKKSLRNRRIIVFLKVYTVQQEDSTTDRPSLTSQTI